MQPRIVFCLSSMQLLECDNDSIELMYIIAPGLFYGCIGMAINRDPWLLSAKKSSVLIGSFFINFIINLAQSSLSYVVCASALSCRHLIYIHYKKAAVPWHVNFVKSLCIEPSIRLLNTSEVVWLVSKNLQMTLRITIAILVPYDFSECQFSQWKSCWRHDPAIIWNFVLIISHAMVHAFLTNLVMWSLDGSANLDLLNLKTSTVRLLISTTT